LAVAAAVTGLPSAAFKLKLATQRSALPARDNVTVAITLF
jgi:hypothetical protein